MDKKITNILDGSKEERNKIVKEFFGLRPEQSYQELEIYKEKNEAEEHLNE